MSISTINFGNSKLNISLQKSKAIYTFIGDIDESFNHREVPLIKRKQHIFILDEISHFTSYGLREWIFLIRKIENYGSIKFQRCSIPVIDQINMTPHALGTGVIESFKAPYFCQCGLETNKLVYVKSYIDHLRKYIAPSFICDHCGTELEFDAIEESYFSFIEKSTPQVI